MIYPNYPFYKSRHSWRSKTSDKYKKELIKNSTEAEVYFYNTFKPLLKGYSKIQKQKRFFTPKSFIIADFCLRAYKVIVEIDGDYHKSETQQEIDRLKDETYKYRGYKVIRFSNEDVLNNTDIVKDKLFNFLGITQPDHRGISN